MSERCLGGCAGFVQVGERRHACAVPGRFSFGQNWPGPVGIKLEELLRQTIFRLCLLAIKRSRFTLSVW